MVRTWRVRTSYKRGGRRMRCRARGGAAHHPTCVVRGRRSQRAQAAPLPAARRALPRVGKRERYLRRRVVSVQSHRLRFCRRGEVAREVRRYLRLYGFERVRRRSLILRRGLPGHRELLSRRRRVFRVDLLPGYGGRRPDWRALARRR